MLPETKIYHPIFYKWGTVRFLFLFWCCNLNSLECLLLFYWCASIVTDSVPMISSIISFSATASFLVTSSAAGLLTISTASLQSIGAVSRPSSLTTDPSRSLFVWHLTYIDHWIIINFYPCLFFNRINWTILYIAALHWPCLKILGSDFHINLHRHSMGDEKNKLLLEIESYLVSEC